MRILNVYVPYKMCVYDEVESAKCKLETPKVECQVGMRNKTFKKRLIN